MATMGSKEHAHHYGFGQKEDIDKTGRSGTGDDISPHDVQASHSDKLWTWQVHSIMGWRRMARYLFSALFPCGQFQTEPIETSRPENYKTCPARGQREEKILPAIWPSDLVLLFPCSYQNPKLELCLLNERGAVINSNGWQDIFVSDGIWAWALLGWHCHHIGIWACEKIELILRRPCSNCCLAVETHDMGLSESWSYSGLRYCRASYTKFSGLWFIISG